VKGFKAGDRIVIRLYDIQNRFLHESEFEALSANTTVNLILSSNPTEYKVVRTVYSVDADMENTIDAGTTTYDYFTQVNNQGDVADISSQYAVGQKEQAQVQQRFAVEAQGKKPRQHCNQGIGNGAEGCDPGNSHPHGGRNDEGGRTPSGKK
jgi:hypothetical protein